MEAFANLPIIDCHVHMRGLSSLANLLGMLEAADLSAMNILCVPALGGRNVNQNAVGLLFKAMHPGRFYAFGGLHYDMPAGEEVGFAEQARRMLEAGCDGMKMLEGKPTERKRLGHPLDSPIYHEYYAFMQSQQAPILCHVGDPASFWDPEQTPQWARDRGWFYGDGTFPSLEELYGEVERVLAMFPELPVIFAHFLFLSGDIERAASFLDRWPSARFDLTPGVMYGDFLAARGRWRDFFLKYQDRILIGTDNSGGTRAPNPEKVAAAASKVAMIRTFLESRDATRAGETHPSGIHLGPDVLAKIYAGNMQRYAGAEPKEVNLDLALEECERAMRYAKSGEDESATVAELLEVRRKLDVLRSGAP